MGFFSQMKEGWKTALENGFWKTVKGEVKEATDPLAEELQKYYDYWDSRHFSDEVNARLAKIAKIIDPQVVAQIIAKAKQYQEVDADVLKEIMGEIPQEIKEANDLNGVVKGLLKLIKVRIEF